MSAPAERRKRARSKGTKAKPKAGLVLGGRYRLISLLGRGGYSEVWEAEDQIGGGPVAVKVLLDRDPGAPGRIRGELAILRLHPLPGVVRLLDEGVSDELPFLVMELVRGEPFPGKGRFRSWPAVVETAIALIEALARLHAEGVIHQDLKPANVLVDAGGKPTILDFGIASDRRLEDTDDASYLVGTVPFMAPERLRGEPVTPQADLYSLGVLLFAALTGRLPHRASRTEDLAETGSGTLPRRASRTVELVQTCRDTPAPPVRRVAPHVPPNVATLVDLLLSKDPARRPATALEVLAILRGHPKIHPEPSSLRIGGDAPVEAILRLVREGRPVDLVGPRWTGRTRCLKEVMTVLEGEGRRVTMLHPVDRPFASIGPIVNPLDDYRAQRLAVVAGVVDARLTAALAGGLVVLADDVARMDAHSAAALARCRKAGALARVFEEAPPRQDEGAPTVVRLAPLDVTTLMGLFASPERLFHVRSRAATILHTRTGGLQGRVADELHQWARAGIITPHGDGFIVVARETLEGLMAQASAPQIGFSHTSLPGAPLDPGDEDLLIWLSRTWPDATPELLAACKDLPVWQIEAHLDSLIARGAARPGPNGTVEPIVATSGGSEWSADRRQRNHWKIANALPAGAPRRFFHLASGIDNPPREQHTATLAEEAVMLSRSLAARGDVARAMAALHEALLRVRRQSPSRRRPAISAEERLLATLLDVALSDGTEPVVGRVQYEIGRARARTPFIEQIDRLVEAALAYTAGGERAFRLVEEMRPFEDLELERRRQGLRARAARRCAPGVEDRAVDDIVAWAASLDDDATKARLASWVGFWHYRRGRFSQAASHHARAAEGDPWLIERVLSSIATASAMMETFELEEAARWAEDAVRGARACSSPHIEARAEWTLRASQYRRGMDSVPDFELVEAVEQLRARDLEATLCLTEAAFGYRLGRLGDARSLAQRAAERWRFVHDPWPRMLARSLALAAGEPASPGEIEKIGHRLCACPISGIGIQALGLLARARGGALDEWRIEAPSLAGLVARAGWGIRMDVLSVQEALDALGVIV